jgi:hypothetical protein
VVREQESEFLTPTGVGCRVLDNVEVIEKGWCSMKSSPRMLCLVVLGLIAVVALAAEPEPNNMQCITNIESGECGDTGDLICTMMEEDTGSCGGTCGYCHASSGMPSEYCVGYEGADCHVTTASVQCAQGQVAYFTAECEVHPMNPGEDCSCTKNKQSQGNCGTYIIMTCDNA